jgi:transposase-like protein
MAKQALSIPKLVEKILDEAKAYEFLEGLRWPNGPICPHCGNDKAYFLTPKNGVGRGSGKKRNLSVRRVWKCAKCRKQFSVLTGTVMHGSKISVRTWVFVLFEMCSSKNGVSAREIARKYEVTDEAAWFMTMRIREGMKRDPLAGLLTGIVTADETWIGGNPRNRHKRQRHAQDNNKNDNKTVVLSLVHRETGEVRSQVVPNVRGATLKAAIAREVDLPATVLHTDSAMAYTKIGWKAAGHQSVNHVMGEYVRGDVTTNHAEGYFSQLKRSIDGTHHAVSAEHLPRYLAEFDYRFSTRKMTDADRMSKLLGQVGGRRLTYDTPKPPRV